jgi:hypothetical protein
MLFCYTFQYTCILSTTLDIPVILNGRISREIIILSSSAYYCDLLAVAPGNDVTLNTITV